MKTVLLILLFGSLSLMAQFPNPIDFNTATNATNTGTISVNSNDLHWTVALTNSVGPYVSAVSCGNAIPAFWTLSPYVNANWISYPHTCTVNPSEHSCLNPLNVDAYYKLSFNLPSNNCGIAINTPSAYCISFDFYADNSVFEIFVNGNLSYLNPNPNPYYETGYLYNAQKTVSLCNYWQNGLNSIIVHVKSGANPGPTWEGLLAQANLTVNPLVGLGLVANPTVSNVTCFGASNGSATITVSGGLAPYSYTWFPSGGNSAAAIGLSSGIYTVLATNAFSCSVTKTLNVLQPAVLNAFTSIGNIQCNGGIAYVNIQASGGTLPYNGIGTYTQTPGVYSYTVTDSHNCFASVSATITQPPVLVASSSHGNILCNGGTTTVNVLASGGSPPYSGVGAFNHAAGIYSYTISDFNNCTSVTSGTITQPLAWAALSNYGNILCNGGTTTVNVTAAGGTPPHIGIGTFNHSAGVYSHTVTDANNCFAVTSGTITQPQILMALSAQGNISCYGGSTTVNISSNGGTPPYIGIGIYNQSAGVFSYTVSDFNNCLSVVSGTIAQPEPVSITVSNSQIGCPGAIHTYSASGATSYSWMPGNLSGIIASLNPMATTVYTVSGSNVNGCFGSTTFTQLVLPCVGIEETEVSNLDVFIFPNPTNDIITILSEVDLIKLTLMNSMGMSILHQQSIQSKETSLDLSGLSRGIYFLRIKTLQGEVLEKIIKD